MGMTNDPIEKMLLKITMAFLTSIVIVFVLKPVLGLFGVNPSTGNLLADTLFFFILPVAIAFIAIYRIFKWFSA